MSETGRGGRDAGRGAGASGVEYETKVVRAVRGTEGRSEAKWRNEGWELVSQDQGTLRTEMTFRRPRPKTFGDRLAQGYSAFRGMEPKAQKTVLAGAGALVLVLAVAVGIAVATNGEDEDLAQDGPTPAVATNAEPTEPAVVEPATEPEEPSAAATASGATPSTEEPQESETAEEAQKAAPYTYAGPEYSTLWVDEDVVRGGADQHWVLVEGLDSDAGDFRDQVKLVISDVAHDQGTDILSVSVVTDQEIAAYESDLVGPEFVEENGQAYVDEVVRPAMETGYLAWYTGGFDPNTGELSDSDEAFEILWFPAGDDELETWRP